METLAERFGQLALACVHQEYPNKIAHVLQGDEDALPPRELTPAFYGCYDWHSSVHGHWLLARLAHLVPDSPLAAPARAALERSLTAENIEVEVRYLEGAGRVSFERPYGLAWLLQLAAELRTWRDEDAQRWAQNLEPLEALAAQRLADWIPKLSDPIRGGEHSQTAFAFGLIYDWTLASGDRELRSIVRGASYRFYGDDKACPLAYEPSGHDFLSPCLAEADLMRRLMRPTSFSAWLGAFLPQIPRHARGEQPDPTAWLAPAVVTNPEDPKLAHLDGLNLSRAWMLEGIASGLPVYDPRLNALLLNARAHRLAGVDAVTGEHYEGGHWLGSFATYLVTGRGRSAVVGSGSFEMIARDVDRELARQEVLPRAHQALRDVRAFFETAENFDPEAEGFDFESPILIDISDRHFVPSQTGRIIWVPARRLKQDDSGYGISMVHEVVHVVAASAYRPDRFYDDGLAVYLQWKLGTASSFPDFGRDLYAQTLAVAEEVGGLLPLDRVEPTRQRLNGSDLLQLAYLQEGAVTRFLIEEHGLDRYLRVYRGEDFSAVYGWSQEELAQRWIEHLEEVSEKEVPSWLEGDSAKPSSR
ncbi:MAG: DUF2891 domain-containing protein [Acidobacteriota bacterium]